MTVWSRATSCLSPAVGLALALLIGNASPVKADLSDCFNALVPIASAEQLAEITAKTTECGSEATTNPVLAVVMAVMIALRADDAFGTSDECNSIVDSFAGVQIAKGLKAIGLPLPGLDDVIAGNTLLSSIPGIDAVMHMTSCGCAVAGAADDLKAVAEKYLGSVDACADFASAVIGDPASGGGILGSGWFGHGAGSPGTIEPDPVIGMCGPGMHLGQKFANLCTDKVIDDIAYTTCVWDGKSYNPSCFCGPGATASQVGTSLNALSYCACPLGQGYGSDGTCKPCPSGQAVGNDGQCREGERGEQRRLLVGVPGLEGRLSRRGLRILRPQVR
jgi:hypothetical protein